jgi:hypothetical protein
MDEEAQRIRSYLQAKAAEYSVEELVAKAEEGLAELLAAARAIDAGAFGARREGEEWSPLDCLLHAAHSNSVNATQVLYVALSGELPAVDDPHLPHDRDGLVAQQREAFDSLYAHVREAAPDAFLDVRWPHPMFGDLNWREWLLFLRIHCRDHARQLPGLAATR